MTRTVILPLLLALIGSASTGLVTWLIAKRRNSGSIRTSEAEVVWEEAGVIRKELRAENIRLANRVEALEAKVDSLQHDMVAVKAESEGLRQVNIRLHTENERLSEVLHLIPKAAGHE